MTYKQNIVVIYYKYFNYCMNWLTVRTMRERKCGDRDGENQCGDGAGTGENIWMRGGDKKLYSCNSLVGSGAGVEWVMLNLRFFH